MSSSMKTHMRSPFLVLSGRSPDDDAADPDVGFRAGQLGQALGAEGLQLLGEALERMTAHVEPERLFLDGQLLRLGPRRGVGERDGHRRSVVRAASKKRHLPSCRFRC